MVGNRHEKNPVKFGHVVCDIRVQTDRHAHHKTLLHYRGAVAD